MNSSKHYIATGYVWGHLWGGGQGGYASETLTNDSKTNLLKEANEMLESGSLDSGMGYESLIGAWLNIEEIETIKDTNNKEFHRSEFETIIIGELSDSALECIENVNLYN